MKTLTEKISRALCVALTLLLVMSALTLTATAERNDGNRASANLTDADYNRDIPEGSWFDTAARSASSNLVKRGEARYRELRALPAGETGTLFEELAPDGDTRKGLSAMEAYASGGRPDVALSPAAADIFKMWADDKRRHNYAAAQAGIIQGMVGWGYNNPVGAAVATLLFLLLVFYGKRNGGQIVKDWKTGARAREKNRIRHRLEKAARRTLREEEERKLTEEVMREMNDEKGK